MNGPRTEKRRLYPSGHSWLTARVLMAALVCVAGTLTAAGLGARGTDEDGQVVRWGRLGVLNNQWGAALGHADAASYQHVRVEDDSRVVFEFDWRNKTPADAAWVKAFPSIVAGWHYGVPVYPGDPTLLNLPVQLLKKPKLATSLRALRSGGTNSDVMNLAWDIWLTSSMPNPAATNPVAPAAEIMVWPWRQNQGPLTLEGSSTRACSRASKEPTTAAPIARNISVWNTKWDLYFGCASDGHTVWPALSFVAQSPLASDAGDVVATGNLGDFAAYASANASRWTTWNRAWWIAGVELGSEIIQGSGSWTIAEYRIEP